MPLQQPEPAHLLPWSNLHVFGSSKCRQGRERKPCKGYNFLLMLPVLGQTGNTDVGWNQKCLLSR